jgi:hypothetical protein
MRDETQKSINFGDKLSFILSFFLFFLSASTAAATYIFTAPNCTTTTISNLEPCALDAELHTFHTELQHFILRFNKMSLLCPYTTERADWG